MNSVSIVEAERKFASALQELRRKHCAAFRSWLDYALASTPKTLSRDIPQKISLIRRQFAEDFVQDSGPAVIEALKPDAKQGVIQQLRLFENRDAAPETFSPILHSEERWRPQTVRIMLGAAIGAAAALLLLSLQTADQRHSSVVTNQTVVAQQVQAPAAPVPSVADTKPVVPDSAAQPAPPAQTPAPAAVQTPVPPPVQVPTPPQTQAPTLREEPRPSDGIEQSALRIIIAALGAAFGAFVVACPPLRMLVGRFEWARVRLRNIAEFSLVYLLARRILLAFALAAAVLAAIGVLGLVFLGPKPIWNVLFGLAAIVAILLTRYFAPSRAQGVAEATQTSAVMALDHQLRVDANIWSVLSAALLVRSTGSIPFGPRLDQVKGIIIERRRRNEAGENILRIVEQELDLAPGGGSSGQEPQEFVWKRELAERYETVGIVGGGDVVSVLAAPMINVGQDGTAEVFRKGRVTRKRSDS